MDSTELRVHMAISGVKRLELAGRIGVDQSTIWRWEKGQVAIPDWRAAAVRAAVYGIKSHEPQARVGQGLQMRTVQQLREERGWRQSDVARRVGVTQAMVWAWETGRSEPRASQLRVLARVFGVSSDTIKFAADYYAGGRNGHTEDAGARGAGVGPDGR